MNAQALKKFVEENQKLAAECKNLLAQCDRWERECSLFESDRELLMDFGNEADERAKEVEARVQELGEELEQLSDELQQCRHKLGLLGVVFWLLWFLNLSFGQCNLGYVWQYIGESAILGLDYLASSCIELRMGYWIYIKVTNCYLVCG